MAKSKPWTKDAQFHIGQKHVPILTWPSHMPREQQGFFVPEVSALVSKRTCTRFKKDDSLAVLKREATKITTNAGTFVPPVLTTPSTHHMDIQLQAIRDIA
eukprot:scaffold2134_cov93-Cylindrotheca_fusiformis.AAC.18